MDEQNSANDKSQNQQRESIADLNALSTPVHKAKQHTI